MKKRVLLMAGVLLVLFGLIGCSGNVPSQQARAIVAEMKHISQSERSFAALQYDGIKEQVKEQYEKGRTSTQYQLTVERFDVLGVDVVNLVLEEPAFDINTEDIEEYTLTYMEMAQSAIETYFNKEKEVELMKQDLLVTLKEVDGEWQVEISPSEINIIVTSINRDITSKTREMAEKSEGYLQLEAIEKMRAQLREANIGESYVKAVRIEDIQLFADGYTLTLSYPDPNEVYSKAVEESYKTFQTNEEWNTTPFTLESLIEKMQTEIEEAVHSIENHLQTTYVDESSDFVKEIVEIKEAIFSEYLGRVNTEFVTQEVDRPTTRVLSGANTGQKIRISNETEILQFKDVHFAFYRISGTDVTEAGSLTLTGFMRGGEVLTLHLPVGNYKLVQTRGATWYGEELKFGPFGISDTASNVIEIQQNYEYELVI